MKTLVRRLNYALFKNKKFWDLFIIKNSFFPEAIKLFFTQKPITSLLGPYLERSRTRIEIDLTYACNLLCINCGKSCGLAPSSEHLSLAQIKKFIKESIDNQTRWELIKIIGGEPTLHPQVIEIVNALLEYKTNYAPECRIVFVSNGYGESVNKTLLALPKGITILNTAKKGIHQHFVAFNMAPCDLKRYRFADYSIGCTMAYNCGIGLTPYGYYPCPVAGGGIDRIMGLDIGRKRLPAQEDTMTDQMKSLCRYCGFFVGRRTDKKIVTPTWKTSFEKYAKAKPQLSTY